MVNPTYSSRESTSISMRPPEGGTFHVQFSWIWSPARWTLYAQDHLVNCFDRITLFSDSLVSICFLIIAVIAFFVSDRRTNTAVDRCRK